MLLVDSESGLMKKRRVSSDFSKRVDALWKLLLLIDSRQGSLKIKFSFADARHQFMAITGKNIYILNLLKQT